MAWHSFEIGMQLRHGRGCARSSCAQVYYKSGAFAVAGEFQGVSQNGGAFLSCSEGQDYQQLSELWFRQSVCWRQLTAAARAASSLTRIPGELRFDSGDRQPASGTYWSSSSTGAEAETGCGREVRDRRGTFPKNLGCTPYAVRHRWLMTLVV